MLARKYGGEFDVGVTSQSRDTALSATARSVVEGALSALPSGAVVVDHCVHVLGSGESGCWFHPDYRFGLLSHPRMHIKFAALRSAAVMDVGGKAEDVAFLERLVSLSTSGGLCSPDIEQLVGNWTRMPRGAENGGGGKSSAAVGAGDVVVGHGGGGGGGGLGVARVIVAQDQRYGERGQRLPDRSKVYTPNSYVVSLARERPGLLVPAVSVHPYRTDAVEELERYARQGVRLVHWHPAMMGVDPLHAACRPMYRKMVVWGMTLLCHVGASGVRDHDDLGNPLRLRGPLRQGVTVVALQGASKGESPDLDHPTSPKVPAWDLLHRLLRDQDNNGKLFVDISSATSAGRTDALISMLDDPSVHPRLVYASAYPRPAVKHLAKPSELARVGLVTKEDAHALEEIRLYNPLLYDLVVKLTVRGPTTGCGFPSSVFVGSPLDLVFPLHPRGAAEAAAAAAAVALSGPLPVRPNLSDAAARLSAPADTAAGSAARDAVVAMSSSKRVDASAVGASDAERAMLAALVCDDTNSILSRTIAGKRAARAARAIERGDSASSYGRGRRGGRRSAPSSRETSESGVREGMAGKRRAPPPISVPATPSRRQLADDDVAMSGTPTRTASHRWTPKLASGKKGSRASDLRRKAAAGAHARAGSSSSSDF